MVIDVLAIIRRDICGCLRNGSLAYGVFLEKNTENTNLNHLT